MNNNFPTTLQQAVKFFADEDICFSFVASMRWTDGAICTRCEGQNLSFLKTRKIWKCLDCKKQFSVKVGTIFEKSPIGLDKWLLASWLISNAKNGISSYEIHRTIGVTQNKNKTEFENFVEFTRKLLKISNKDLDNKPDQPNIEQKVLKDGAK